MCAITGINPMQTGLQVTSGGNLTVLSTRDNAAHHMIVHYGNPLLDAVDYSDPIAVEAARTAILQMPVWDNILGWVFRDGCEPEGRVSLVETVLCQRAAIWRQENVGRTTAMELGEDALVNAQAAFFSLLSPLGCQFMTAKYQGEPGGMCYTPKTGNADVDELLRMVVPEEVISALRELGPDTNEIADTLEKHAQSWNSVQQSRESAARWKEQATAKCTTGDFDMAAVALRNAAAAWKAGDRPVMAAIAYDAAASNWHSAMEKWKVDYYARAGQSSEDAAVLWEAAHWPREAAMAYSAAAVSWTKNESHSSAAQAHEMAAKALLNAGEVEAAAEQWGLAARSWVDAGRHDKAAQSWKAALLAADTAPDDIFDAIAGGKSLFDFALENEETLQG